MLTCEFMIRISIENCMFNSAAPLYPQVTTLQHQMQELQQSRDAQDRELGRLRNEAMALVASTTSLEQQSQESVARLAHRADEAEMRAQGLVGEVEDRHGMKLQRGTLSFITAPYASPHYDLCPPGSSTTSLNM